MVKEQLEVLVEMKVVVEEEVDIVMVLTVFFLLHLAEILLSNLQLTVRTVPPSPTFSSFAKVPIPVR